MKTRCDVPTFWLANKEMVYAYIKKRVNDQELTKDLTQEVLLKVYHFCFTQCGVKNTRAWLFDIAHNTVVDYYRKQKEAALSENEVDFSEDKTDDVYQDISIFVRPLLVCLPENYAQPLLMELEGITQREIAQQLQLNLSATKSRIQRAKLMVKSLIFECFHLELKEDGKIASFQAKSDCVIVQNFLTENIS